MGLLMVGGGLVSRGVTGAGWLASPLHSHASPSYCFRGGLWYVFQRHRKEVEGGPRAPRRSWVGRGTVRDSCSPLAELHPVRDAVSVVHLLGATGSRRSRASHGRGKHGHAGESGFSMYLEKEACCC